MNDNDVTPVMFDHCQRVYQVMSNEAQVKEVEGGVKMGVWEGFLTRLIQERLGLAVPYYSSIRGHLTRMNCIRQMRRGGGNSPSQWEMLKPPTKELFANAEATGNVRQRQRESHTQQIADLTRRVSKLEKNEQTLISTIVELQRTLEEHVTGKSHPDTGAGAA